MFLGTNVWNKIKNNIHVESHYQNPFENEGQSVAFSLPDSSSDISDTETSPQCKQSMEDEEDHNDSDQELTQEGYFANELTYVPEEPSIFDVTSVQSDVKHESERKREVEDSSGYNLKPGHGLRYVMTAVSHQKTTNDEETVVIACTADENEFWHNAIDEEIETVIKYTN